jgi:hypothetical protein
MINALAWQSSEVGDRLTPEEVEQLGTCLEQLADTGKLSNGYVGASRPLYWHRLPKEN